MSNATFTRSSIAYQPNGTIVAPNQPRYETACFGAGIIIEEGTTNLLTSNQSSLETDLTGFGVEGGTSIARVTNEFWSGSASLQAVTPGIVAGEDFYVTVSGVTLPVGEKYTASVYLKGSGTIELELAEQGSVHGSTHRTATTLTSEWQRISVVHTIINAANTQLKLTVATTKAEAITFYADGLQIEKKGYATSWQIGGTAREDERLTIPTLGIFNKGQFSIEFNIKPTSDMAGGVDRVVWYCYVDDNNDFGIGIDPDGYLYGQTRYNGKYQSVSDTIPLQVGTIYNYCITWDGSNITIYRDGDQRNSRGYTECTGPVSSIMHIGEDGAGFIIDDFRMSKVARTMAEYQVAYNSGEPLPIDSATTCKMNFENNLQIAALGNQTPTFTRYSVAYKQDDSTVADNQPRYENDTFGKGIMIEEETTNLFPHDQSLSLNSAWTSQTLDGTYTISIREGTGQITLSGGTTGTVTVGDSLTFSVANAAVIFTPSGGTPQRNQLEAKSYSTSWQDGDTAYRYSENLSIPTANVFTKSNWAIEIRFSPVGLRKAGARLWEIFIDSDNYYCLEYGSSGNILGQVKSTGVETTISMSVPAVIGADYSICFTGDGTILQLFVSGELIETAISYTEPIGDLPAKMYIGCDYAEDYQGNSIFDDLRISNRTRSLTEHQTVYISGEPLPIDIATTCKMNFDGNIHMSFYKDPSTFTRTSVAYKQDGTLVDIGQPRYEAARFGQGIMLEEGTANLLTANQSSIETDLTGFGVEGGTSIARVTNEFWSGSASLQAVTPGIVAGEDFYVTVSGLTLAVGVKFTASVYLKGSGTIQLELAEQGFVYGSTHSTATTLTSEWQRVSVVHTIINAANTQLKLTVATTTEEAITFYADGLQIEKKGYASSWQIGGTERAAETVSIPTAGIFNKGNFSIEFNIQPTSDMTGGVDRVVWYCYVDDNNDFGIGVDPNGYLYGQTRYNGGYQSVSDAIPLQVGTIYKYCITWDGSNITVYRDGDQRNSGGYTECTGPVSSIMHIGEDGAGFIIDDFRMSNVARTLAEYQEAYNSGEPLPIDSATTYKQSFNGPAWTAGYTYDDSDHLISVALSQKQTVIYDYDQNGNLMTISKLLQPGMAAAFIDPSRNTISANKCNSNNEEEITSIKHVAINSINQGIMKEEEQPESEDTGTIAAETSLVLGLQSNGNYNLVDDWITTNNPNGAWSYGYKTSKSGDLILYDKTGTTAYNVIFWYSLPTWDKTPSTWKNTTSAYHYNIAPGEVSIHPGPSQQPCVIRWTSPVSGNISLAGHFGAGDRGTMGYYIYQNNESVWERTAQAGDAYFSLNLDVEIGDEIDFMVGDAYWYGNTPIDILINTENAGLSGKYARHYCLIYDPQTRKFSWVLEPVDAATGAHMIEKKLIKVNGAITIPFDISYNSLMLAEGPLGKGWGHNYEIRLAELADSNIRIYWTANRSNTFTPVGNNQYTSSEQACRLDLLVKNIDDTYNLTRKNQSVYKFDATGKLTQIQNGHGQLLNLSYDGSNRLQIITEPLSARSLTLTYNANDLIEGILDGLSREITLTYDTNHNLIEIEYPDSKSIIFTYDAQGQVLTETDGEGKLVFENTYDDKCRVIQQKDGLNQTNTMSYDEASSSGQIITTITDRNGKSKIYTHDSNYQLIKITDELGNETSYTYDNYGNRTSITDALNNTITMTYDSRGNLLTVTDSLDNTTTMTYDSRNNLLTMTNADNKTITNTFDPNNNLLSTTDALNNTTTFVYNTDGLLASKTLPRGGVTTYTYQNGQVRTITDPDSITLTYAYDNAGRLASSTNASSKTSYISYDVRDNIIQLKDPLNHTSDFTFDSNGKMLTKTDANGHTTTYEYDDNLNLLSVTDPLNHITTYDYDPEGRLITITNARGYTMTMVYDDKGRQVSLNDPLGNTTTVEYDDVSNVTGRYDALNKKIAAITYDALHNPLTITDANNKTTTNEYDSLSRLTQSTNPLNQITQFSFDEINRLTQTTDPQNASVSQQFDSDGNRSALIDANNNTLSFTHNLAGRLTQVSSATGNQQYAYNILGYLFQITNGRNQVSTNVYDDAGRLTSKTDNTGSISYTYDNNGNILTVTESSGAINRVYDELNRIVSYTDARNNIIQYQYDEVSNLTRITYPDTKQVNYTYDAANRLIQVSDWSNRITTYSYDANSRLVKTMSPDGSREQRSYDDIGRIIEIKDIKSSNKIINQYNYSYDDAGKIISEYNSNSRVPYGTNKAEITHTTDNRIATYNGENVTYDADGNMTGGPLKGSLQNFAFDCRNRLTGVRTTSYTYDAENNRIGVTISSQNTSYVVNPNAALSQVLEKTDPDETKTYYVYGLGLIGEERNGVYKTYHFDLRGSTVALTSINGTILEKFQYGPYGEIQWVTGYSSIPFLYNGRDGVITDENGLYYMRARYYNPDLKRFISRDEIIGNVLDPMSLNRYAYVKGNPVIGVDPLGYDPNYDINDLSDFDALINEHKREEEARAQLNQLAAQSGLPNPVSADFDYNNIESVRANPKSTFTSAIGFESSNQETARGCAAYQQSITGQIWAGMSQVPDALANAARELPGAIFNKDVGDAAKKTGGAMLVAGGVVVTGGIAGSASTYGESAMVIITNLVDTFNPGPADTLGGAMAGLGLNIVFGS